MLRSEPHQSDWATRTRQLCVAVALATIVFAGIVGEGPLTGRLGNLVLVALAVAVALGWLEVLPAFGKRDKASAPPALASRTWILVVVGVFAVTFLGVQSWFHIGTVIAGGDVTPPLGTAWISRLFVAWTWSGWNLGGPTGLATQLPWAAVLGVVHALGGSPELAQRIWYTTVFVGAAEATLILSGLLGIRPLPAMVGALAYAFSPLVVANVVPNPVYLATLALLPAAPAIVVAGARGLIGMRAAAVLLAVLAPLMGYVYQNPPLLGMVLAATLSTPLIVWYLYGRATAGRAAWVLMLGLPLTLVVSAYWVVPSVLQLVAVSSDPLAAISSWSWTEGRATVLNALWLNTQWGWNFPEYFPFFGVYDVPPLSIVKFGPALLAFTALALVRRTTQRGGISTYHLPLAILGGSVALGLILLSTGTNPPGNVVFDRLYALPFGWLLREPGRFLMAVNLMYAILIAITIDALPMLAPRHRRLHAISTPAFQASTAVVSVLAVVLPGFPLLTGSIVPDHRPILPSSHVQTPAYWSEMGAFVDKLPLSGGVLVLPPDDFYQMPYLWGYYGNDEFIRDLMNRPVLTPSSQAYIPPTPELLNAIDLATTSILTQNWNQAERLVKLLGTPLLLVRGDLDTGLAARYGRHLPSPSALATALLESPNFVLVQAKGPLLLFALREGSAKEFETVPFYASVNTSTPDLRVLSRLPANAALVSKPPEVGVPAVEQLPPVDAWLLGKTTLSWSFGEAPGWSYSLVRLDSPAGAGLGGATVNRVPSERTTSNVEISMPITEDLANGSFDHGLWGPVGDCANFSGPAAQPYLSATVIPAGGPNEGRFLRLATELDSACEAQTVTWHGGPLLITLGLRHVAGAPPRICLWEIGPQRCATLPAVRASSGWTTFSATTRLDPGTTAAQLFLYSDVYVPHTATQNDYAAVRVVELPSLPEFDVIGTPNEPSVPRTLVVHDGSYSPDWVGPPGSDHVLVNGLLNGWIVVAPAAAFTAQYRPSTDVDASHWLAIIGLLATIGLALSIVHWRAIASRLRMRPGRSPAAHRSERP